jgi:hypothetical protein
MTAWDKIHHHHQQQEHHHHHQFSVKVNKQHKDQSNIDDLARKQLLILAIIYFLHVQNHVPLQFYFLFSFFWFVCPWLD